MIKTCSTLLIYNTTLVYKKECEFHKETAVLIKNNKIEKIYFNKREWSKLVNTLNVEKIDAKGNILGPGFIDMHIHGCAGYDTSSEDKEEALIAMAKTLESRGITTFQPTTHFCLTSIKKLGKAINNNKMLQSFIPGIYVEGPFVNKEKKGGLPSSSIKSVNKQLIDELLSIKIGEKSLVRTMTIAPEIEGIDIVINSLLENDVLISFGHSDAKVKDIPKLDKYHFTHLFNAMSGIDHKTPGLAIIPFLYKRNYDLTCEIIADGVHVDIDTLKFTFSCLNEDRVCLISDAMNAATLQKGKMTYLGRDAYSDGRACYYSSDNTLIGSCSLIIDTARDLLEKKIISKEMFFKIGSVNPSRALKLNDRGIIEVGKRADLILLDHKFKVVRVFKQKEI